MKPDLHPTYFTDTKVTCACGNSFVTGSTVESIQVEICSNCHPFFTGKSKLVDTAGRVDKFKARLKEADARKAAQAGRKPASGSVVEVQTEVPVESEIASDSETVEELTEEQTNEK